MSLVQDRGNQLIMPTVQLPLFHPGQVRAYKLPARYKAIRCGRRWGKTDYGKAGAADLSVKGYPVGWFAPDYKKLSEAYNEILETLRPVVSAGNKMEGVIRTTTGGRIDFWTLNDENAGRSRYYKKVFIDEAAFAGPAMLEIWRRSIEPTLFDLSGSCTVMSNTNGIADDNFFWQICNQPEFGFTEYHAPTFENPHLPRRLRNETEQDWLLRREKEIERIRASYHPLVFQQEYQAEFIDWSGVAFFAKDKLLVDGQPVLWPESCLAIFATVDSATKTGKDHDGTGVIYWAIVETEGRRALPYKLVALDWELVQIEGAMLESWIPGVVFKRLEELAQQCRARNNLGTFLEDKNSGMVLLQHARNRKWPMLGIDSKLTALGKSERAIAASPYVYQGMVKFSQPAVEKVMAYKSASAMQSTTRNHLEKQVYGFRVGQKDEDDDLLDCFCYGVCIALGGSGGF